MVLCGLERHTLTPLLQVGEVAWNAGCTPGEGCLFHHAAGPGLERCGELRNSSPVAKDTVSAGPCPRTEFCSHALTPPGNPSLPSSCPADSRLLPNPGVLALQIWTGSTEGGVGKIRFPTELQSLLPFPGTCKAATYPEMIGGEGRVLQVQKSWLSN